MKVFVLTACLSCLTQLGAQLNIFECSPENSHITNAELNNGEMAIFKPCVIFESETPYTTFCYPPKTIKALHEIDIKTDFHANPIGEAYELNFEISDKSDFEVAVMNYSDLNSVLRLKKLEIGISLPEPVQEQVTNFVKKLPGQRLNPYLEWELRAVAEFTQPGFPTLVIDGFYNQEYEAWMAAEPLPLLPANAANNEVDGFYNSLGGYTEIPADYPFLFRFAPPRNGKWQAKIKLYVSGVQLYDSEAFTFQVVESGSLGYVRVGDEQRFLSLGGRSFHPVGINVLWPNTDWRHVANNDIYDPRLIHNLTQPQGDHLFLNEEWRGVYTLPRVYDNFHKLINKLADNGANCLRTVMHPVSMDIEFEHIGDYTGRLQIAQEMDEILELCEARNVKLVWCFQAQYTLYGGTVAGWNSNWRGNPFCYKSLTGSSDSYVFFSDAEAKKYYKQRYRYLLARYGYSTNIALFELFAEVAKDDVSLAKSELIESWHYEMAEYIKSQYNGKIHLLGPSYAGPKRKTDDTFKSPNIDVMSTNMYPGLKCYAKNWIDHVQQEFLNQSHASLNQFQYTTDCELNDGHLGNCTDFIKPMIFSEFDPSEEYCDGKQIELKRAGWQSLFTGLTGAFSWDSYINGNNFEKLGQMKNFISQFDLDHGGWHPGAMERFLNGAWVYRQDWANDMDQLNVYKKNGDLKSYKKADLMYLRSGDGNFAIGVITNKTYNIYTAYENSCVKEQWDSLSNLPLDNDEYIAPPFPKQNIQALSQELKLRGMNSGKYYVNYFNPHDLSNPTSWSYDQGPSVKIEYNIGANEYDYIILFMARRKDYMWSPTKSDSPSFNEVWNDEALWKNASMETEAFEDEITTEIDLAIYPVPSSDKIIIEAEQYQGVVEIIIQAMDGKTVKRFIMKNEQEEIDISTFEKGVYIVKFYVNQREIEQRKIIKL